MGGAMSRQCHTPASSRHAHAAPLKEGAVPGSGGVSRRRVMLVDGVGRGRTAPLPPPSSRQTSMEEQRLLHYLYLHYYYYLYTEYICPLTQFGQYLALSGAQGAVICVRPSVWCKLVLSSHSIYISFFSLNTLCRTDEA